MESSGTVSRVRYDGSERLSVERTGKEVRFRAHAVYTRDALGEQTSEEALFVQALLPDGSFEDRVNQDPDFLTILNQPFAVQLDPPTLRDLRLLHGRVPFTAASPLGSDAMLHGYLRPGTNGPVNGHPTVAVRFEAQGPMAGPLPGHAGATIGGTMRLDGTAYYSLNDALLLALDARLTIEARLRDRLQSAGTPVRITYRRTIRAATNPGPG